jgi:hypothetical protein
MNQMTKGIARALALSLFCVVAVVHAQRAIVPENGLGTSGVSDGVPVGTAANVNSVPMVNWAPAERITVRATGDRQKAATDVTAVYRPLPLCRLMDSRVGQPSALGTNGGILLANNGRLITPAGACGIPTTNVAALSVSFVTQNTTVNNGGYITFIPTVGSPVAGTNLVFNPGVEWGGTTANVNAAGNGSFVAYVAQSNVHLIVDINGYYQDLNFVDTNTELDISGATTGDLLQITNTAAGSALSLGNGTTGGRALTVTSGAVRVSGAGVGSNQFVFQFNVNTAGTASAGTGTGCFSGSSDIHVITHPLLNGDPGAIVFITPKYNNLGGDGIPTATGSYVALYLGNTASCGGGTGAVKWAIWDRSGTNIPNTAKFNIMVIKP